MIIIFYVVILVVVMYFMMWRPQQRKLQEQRAMLAELDVGEDVVTESGIYGTISSLDGDTVFLMVADGVEIKVAKSAIASIVVYGDAGDE